MGIGWTGLGESANPTLNIEELPLGLVACTPQAQCALPSDTAVEWISRTPRGHLFVVAPPCVKAGCEAWLVEKSATQIKALLGVSGQYQLIRSAHTYPDVRVRKDISAAEVLSMRFHWQDGAYLQAESETLFRIDGEECGTRRECLDAAQAAFAVRPGRALKIWETVDKVSWF